MKTKISKSRKIGFFKTGLVHGFGQKLVTFPDFYFNENVSTNPGKKMLHFSNFFLGNIHQENVFYDILGRKNVFLGHKNKKFKNSNNWYFSKEVDPWFWSKIGHFSNFFF